MESSKLATSKPLFRWWSRWWSLRAYILLPIVSSRLSALLGLFALIFAFAAGAGLGWANIVGKITTALLALLGMVFFLDVFFRHLAMKYLGPYPNRKLRPEDFTNSPRELSKDYRFVSPTNGSMEQLYPYVDLSDQEAAIAVANPDLKGDARLSLYSDWYAACPKGFLHLEKLVTDKWRPIAVVIALPISGDAHARIRSSDPTRKIKIVDLRRGEIKQSIGKEAKCLLIDTWIVDKPFRGEAHGKSDIQGGYANTLVLRAVGRFWNSTNRFADIDLLVETNHVNLKHALEGLLFLPVGRSKIEADLIELSTGQLRKVFPDRYQYLRAAVKALESVDLTEGTVEKSKS